MHRAATERPGLTQNGGSVREYYSRKIIEILRGTESDHNGTAIARVLALMEEAAVRAAGRGAGVALERVADLGRVSEAARQARELERLCWTPTDRRTHA